MSQSSISLMRKTRVARSATICPMASPLKVSSICTQNTQTAFRGHFSAKPTQVTPP